MGRRIGEFATTRVCDFTELIGEVRHHTHGLQGLVTLTVRNASRGWSCERPLMLYPPRHGSATPISPTPRSVAARPHMPFPWETH